MKRTIIVAGLMLAACGQQTAAPPAAPDAPAGFPRQTASYVGKYLMRAGGEAQRPMTIYASGAKMRMEGPPPQEARASDIIVATIMDPAAKRLIMFRVGPAAPKAAMTMSLASFGAAASLFALDEDLPRAKAVGADKVAGLACRIWEIPGADGAPANQVCLTGDGVVLRTNESGDADKPTLLAQEIRQGPQDPALFVTPAGYEVIDYSKCTDMASEAMAAARAGEKPDMAKLQECAALGAKVSAIFGR